MAEGRVILTQFPGGGIMPYLSEDILEVGDKVVIETNKQKLVVAEVCQISDICPKIAKKADKYTVQKLDMTRYKQR